MKPVYYSEKTKKYYEKEADAIAAEKEWDEKNAVALKLKEERQKAADEIDTAYKAYIEAYDHYIELMNAFIKKYKAYHTTYTQELSKPVSLFDLVNRVMNF